MHTHINHLYSLIKYVCGDNPPYVRGLVSASVGVQAKGGVFAIHVNNAHMMLGVRCCCGSVLSPTMSQGVTTC